MRYGQCAAMIALDLRCPVERPVASCRKVARQQSFESRSHGLSLKLYARSCPGSFEGGSCRYHTVFYLLGDRLRGRALDAPFVEVFDAREHAWPCIRYKGKGGVRSEEHTSELQSLMRISYADFCL